MADLTVKGAALAAVAAGDFADLPSTTPPSNAPRASRSAPSSWRS